MNLQIALKRRWFEDILSGIKTEEYRLYKTYWAKRLIGRDYQLLILTLGYPHKSDTEKFIILPYRGYTIKEIVSEEWNDEPQEVFAIRSDVNYAQ